MNLHFLLWTILLAQSAIVTSGQPIRIENQTDLNKIAIHLFDHILKLVREAFNSHDQAHLNQLVEPPTYTIRTTLTWISKPTQHKSTLRKTLIEVI
uniref:SH2 domain-containing protein n=1 Tax=Caenorhabditis tropicalis TaxID=1561998 RepID=A0A1I7TLM7_9PELO